MPNEPSHRVLCDEYVCLSAKLCRMVASRRNPWNTPLEFGKRSKSNLNLTLFLSGSLVTYKATVLGKIPSTRFDRGYAIGVNCAWLATKWLKMSLWYAEPAFFKKILLDWRCSVHMRQGFLGFIEPDLDALMTSKEASYSAPPRMNIGKGAWSEIRLLRHCCNVLSWSPWLHRDHWKVICALRLIIRPFMYTRLMDLY